MKLSRMLVVVAVVAAFASAATLALRAPSSAGFDLEQVYLLEAPRPMSEFELIDQHHRPLTPASLQGDWSLVFIGFTHCPDVCPSTLALLGGVDELLRKNGHRINVIFVSVDPDRDTPDVLKSYAGFFSDDIVAATGSTEQLNGFCDDLDFAFVKVPTSRGDYTVDHSAALAVIDPEVRVAGHIVPPFKPEQLVTELSMLMKAR